MLMLACVYLESGCSSTAYLSLAHVSVLTVCVHLSIGVTVSVQLALLWLPALHLQVCVFVGAQLDFICGINRVSSRGLFRSEGQSRPPPSSMCSADVVSGHGGSHPPRDS